jgi:hypothetical protein
MPAWPHPDLVSRFKAEVGYSIRWNYAAMSHAASKTRRFRTQQRLAYRVNSVGPDKGIH